MSLNDGGTFGFTIDPDARLVRLKHPRVEATWKWTEEGQVFTESLTDKASQTTWITPDLQSSFYVPPLSYGRRAWLDDPFARLYGPLHKALEPPTVTVEPDGRSRAVWRLQPQGESLLLTWTIEAFPNHAVIRQWTEMSNTGDEPLVLDRLPIFTWAFAGNPSGLSAHYGLARRGHVRLNEWPDWFDWNTVPLGNGMTGKVISGHRKAATFLGLTAEDDGPGLFFGWESNAEAICEFGDLLGNGFLAVDCRLEPAYRLEPGAAIAAPAGFTGVATGDLDELSFRCQRFVDDVLAWKADDERFPFVTFNSWGYEAEINEASMRECFDVCQRLGVELFVVDFGWEDADWNPLQSRFPNGLAPLANAAHEAGLLFGVHLSFGNLSNLSKAYAEHPEWTNGAGQWAYREEGEVYRLVLGHPDAQDWIVDTLVRVIDVNNIDYFLTDNYLWGDVNPDVQETHATIDYMSVAEGFDRVLERFHALRPNVLIEHCDNGAALATYKMVQQHVTSIGADAAGSLYERIHAYRFSRVLPPRYLDHYACDRPAVFDFVGTGLTEYDYRSHMFGGPLIFMTNIGELTPEDAEWTALQRSIALFKRIRHRVLEGKVLHLLEPQPLQQVGRGWDGWDAIGSYHEASDTAVIFAFRLGPVTDERTIPIRGLRPDSTYRVSFEDQSNSFTKSGAELMTDGITLTLPPSNRPTVIDRNGMVRGSEVIFIDAVAD